MWGYTYNANKYFQLLEKSYLPSDTARCENKQMRNMVQKHQFKCHTIQTHKWQKTKKKIAIKLVICFFLIKNKNKKENLDSIRDTTPCKHIHTHIHTCE